MATPKKVASVEELKEKIQGNDISIMAQYQGITVEQVTALRAKLRAEGIQFKVFKNTLASRALNELELGDATSYMEGPTVWAFSTDPVAPAKILKDFAKEAPVVVMRGGILDGKVVSGESLNTLASLPSQDQLRAQVIGTIAAPLRNLVGVLSALPRNLVNVLDQVRKQKEEAEAA